MVIMGVLSYAVFTYIQSTNRSYKSAEVEQEMSLYMLGIQRALAVGADCTRSLSEAGPLAREPGRTVIPKIYNTENPDLPNEMEVGTVASTRRFQIGSIIVEEYGPSPVGCDPVRPTEYCDEFVTLKVRFDKRNRENLTPSIWRSLSLVVRSDSVAPNEDRVTHCFAKMDRDFMATNEFVRKDGDTMTGPLIIDLDVATYPPPTAGLNVINGFIRTSEYYIDSDIRLKENFESIEEPLKLLEGIEGKRFQWKNSGQSDYGFIAQEIERTLPELVQTSPENGLKAVKYTSLIPIASEAIKELYVENRKLEKELEELRGLVEQCGKNQRAKE